MKKGKKMPSIELEGESDATFVLKDGKIVRAEKTAVRPTGANANERLEDRLRFEEPRGPKRPGE